MSNKKYWASLGSAVGFGLVLGAVTDEWYLPALTYFAVLLALAALGAWDDTK